jgi:hypothetical protein
LIKLKLSILLSSIFLIIIKSLINPKAKERVFDITLDQMNLSSDKEIQKEKEGILILFRQHSHIYKTAYKMYLDNKLWCRCQKF